MAFPIGLAISGISGLSSLGGLFSGEAKKARLRQEALIRDLGRSYEQDYANALYNKNSTLESQAGSAGDAIAALGRRLGSSLAGAGVSNSSVTAGALTQAQADRNAALADLADRLTQNATAIREQGRRAVIGQQMGLAQQDYENELQKEQAAKSGFASFLGSLSQYNFGKSGGSNTNNALTRSEGGYGSLAPLPIRGYQEPSITGVSRNLLFPEKVDYTPSIYTNLFKKPALTITGGWRP